MAIIHVHDFSNRYVEKQKPFLLNTHSKTWKHLFIWKATSNTFKFSCKLKLSPGFFFIYLSFLAADTVCCINTCFINTYIEHEFMNVSLKLHFRSSTCNVQIYASNRIINFSNKNINKKLISCDSFCVCEYRMCVVDV